MFTALAPPLGGIAPAALRQSALFKPANERFQACFVEVLKWEGGYSDHPKDPGGKTMHGVTQRVYDNYRKSKNLEPRWVKDIAPAEEQDIYRRSYWDEINGDLLPEGVDEVTFDDCVNCGPFRAIAQLQEAVGAKIDGHMGEETMRRIAEHEAHEIINKMMSIRRAFYKRLKNFKTFGQGWLNRCNGVQAAALKMADAHDVLARLRIPAAAPHLDADAQAMSVARVNPKEDPVAAQKNKQVAHATLWGTLSLKITAVGYAIKEGADGLFSALPTIKDSVDAQSSTIQGFASTIGVDWGAIGVWVGTSLILFALATHFGWIGGGKPTSGVPA